MMIGIGIPSSHSNNPFPISRPPRNSLPALKTEGRVSRFRGGWKGQARRETARFSIVRGTIAARRDFDERWTIIAGAKSMARHQSKEQKKTVRRVMHEFKHGELSRGRGGKVENPKQAVAIALHEAGASKYESPEKNRENLRRTKSRERHGAGGRSRSGGGGATRKELYAEAKRRNIPGRSKMSKSQLAHALHG
ncbi:MAG TPA: DUF6496 domain-containing protein [Stellaceae bacterium]|nr:DUF6496 domain-containing protein [Stellaceae bacterium]